MINNENDEIIASTYTCLPDQFAPDCPKSPSRLYGRDKRRPLSYWDRSKQVRNHYNEIPNSKVKHPYSA